MKLQSHQGLMAHLILSESLKASSITQMSSKAAQSYSSYENEEKPQLVYAPYYDAYMGLRCSQKTGMLCPNGMFF